MKKRISLMLVIAAVLALCVGAVAVQAEEDGFSPDKYITFDGGFGELPDGSMSYELEVPDYGVEFTLPENTFIYENAAFKGWLYQYELWQPGEKVIAVEDARASAVWLGDGCMGLVTVNKLLGTSCMSEISADVAGEDPETALIVPSPYEDFMTWNTVDAWFEGWRIMADGANDLIPPGYDPQLKAGEQLFLEAVWNEDLSKAYKVEFNSNAPADSEMTSDVGYIYVKKGEALQAGLGIEYYGYDFDGWYDKPEGGNLIAGDQEEFTPAGDLVLYSHWKVESGEDDPSDEPEMDFVDVPEGAYYYDPVVWAVENGITSGTDETHFSPDRNTTRAQMVTFLWRAAGSPVVNYAMPFTDVDQESYYAEAVRWAAAEKIATGTKATQFSPDASITREQLAAFIYRYAQTLGQGFVGEWYFPLDFADADKVSSWADEPMHWCTMNGIINGTGKNLLSPQGTATRGQIVTMLYRFFELQQAEEE